MTKTVDSYYFTGGLTSRLVRTWIKKEPQRDIPWTPLTTPLAAATVALVSSGALALRTDRPFDNEGERANPWWGDPGYRVIPRGTQASEASVYHLHIPTQFAAEDLNVLLPLDRLDELAAAGVIGAAAPHHYSFMGFLLQPETFLEKSVPAMVQQMHGDGVDLVALFPA